ncbi:MAG: hypothetical protein ACREO5_09385, partial [Candidatus Binatia bacterium]
SRHGVKVSFAVINAFRKATTVVKGTPVKRQAVKRGFGATSQRYIAIVQAAAQTNNSVRGY